MESRGPAKDRLDLNSRNAFRRAARIRDIGITHTPGSDEPLVWIPDQVLGAYGDMLTGKHEYDDFIAHNILDDAFAVG